MKSKWETQKKEHLESLAKQTSKCQGRWICACDNSDMHQPCNDLTEVWIGCGCERCEADKLAKEEEHGN